MTSNVKCMMTSNVKVSVSSGERVMGYLQEINVRVDHGVTEVRLDVGHRLTFDLQSISHPHVTVDLRQAGLHTHTQII